MKLANRMNRLQGEGAYQILDRALKLEKKGKKIIHFEIGQPDFPTPKKISKAGILAIKEGKTRYNPPLGIDELRLSIARYISKTRGITTDQDQVAITPSGKTAIYLAMASILEKGDEVIYPNPGFPTYEVLINFLGCKRRPVPLLEETGFGFDIRSLESQFSSKTRLIILNSPSNPTGGVISKDDLKKVADIVNGSNCWILSDEIYSRILYDGKIHQSIYSLPKMAKRIFLLDGFSKTYAMPGWRLGYLIVPEKVIKRIDYLLTHSVGCTATFTQYAGVQALEGSQREVKKMVEEFKKRRDLTVDSLNNIDGVTCQKPAGAFYVFPNVKSFKKTSKELASYLIEEAGVALLDGGLFGKYGKGYLRISYANSFENIKEGLARIKKALGYL